MKFDGRKQMFATDMEGGIGDQSKFLEEICVFVSPTISIIIARTSKSKSGHSDIVERTTEKRRSGDRAFSRPVRRDFFCYL